MDINDVGAVIALVIGAALGIFLGIVFKSILLGIIVTIFGSGYLFGKWVEGGVPYDIHEIRNNTRKK